MKKIIEIALKEVGTKESPAGSNKVKYNDWVYGRDNVEGPQYPWCGAFASWLFYMAGSPLPKIDVIKGFVGCNYAVNNVAKWGKIVTIPQEGDVCFFDWQGDGRFDHTGIFVKDLGKGLFQSIEGNTGAVNLSNGGEVMICTRKYKLAIFVRANVTLL